MQTKLDLTPFSGALYSLLLVLLLASLLQFFIRLPMLHLLISAGGALLFSVYLIFDIQVRGGGGLCGISMCVIGRGAVRH